MLPIKRAQENHFNMIIHNTFYTYIPRIPFHMNNILHQVRLYKKRHNRTDANTALTATKRSVGRQKSRQKFWD